ncbi:hypothetical protein OIU84_009226 [Salix udensis]|uniref:Uncharacterized protein n=1 Tax=Salix udensis TaxID=889485 RepID=A0AAD6JR50_9ROSI|nr:hypothetical protein OIU84_009226 [Salix udensis]
MKVLFPTLIKWVGKAGEKLHGQLASEIRTVVREEGGVTFQALDKMILTKSVVFEALRIEPPVPFQYGKARENIVVHSHDAAFEIKKGSRFVGDGEKLLKYVYWSNGRETEDPTAENKQCPGKDLVLLVSRVFLVEFFLRYDTFTVETAKALALGSTVTFTSLIKATTV